MMVVDKLYKEKQVDGTTKYFTLRKQFLGKIMDFESKAEAKFEKRHLKAYLNNHDYFTFEGIRCKTQYGVRVIEMTEAEVKAQKKHVEDLFEQDRLKQLPYTHKLENASNDKVLA